MDVLLRNYVRCDDCLGNYVSIMTDNIPFLNIFHSNMIDKALATLSKS